MNGCILNKNDVEIYGFLQRVFWLVLCIVLNCLRGFLWLVLCTSAYSFGILLCSLLVLHLDFLGNNTLVWFYIRLFYSNLVFELINSPSRFLRSSDVLQQKY